MASISCPRSCVAMLADLFHAGDPQHPTGTATIGSSEAILLGGLALKRRWQDRRKKEGKPYDKPNIVMGSEVHVRSHCPSLRKDWSLSLCSPARSPALGAHKWPCATGLALLVCQKHAGHVDRSEGCC